MLLGSFLSVWSSWSTLFLCDHWPVIVVNMVSFQKNFCVLKEEDILKHQMDAIERVSVVLSITEVEASILLRYFHWLTLWHFFVCLIWSLLPCLFSTYLETTFCFLVIISNNLYSFFLECISIHIILVLTILASWGDERLLVSGVLVKFMMNGLRMKRESGILWVYWRDLLFHHLMTQRYFLWIIEYDLVFYISLSW